MKSLGWVPDVFILQLVTSKWQDKRSVWRLDRRGRSFHLLLGFFFFSWLCHRAFRILVPWPGIKPRPQQWKCWVLTTGLPGNSALRVFETSRQTCPVTSRMVGCRGKMRAERQILKSQAESHYSWEKWSCLERCRDYALNLRISLVTQGNQDFYWKYIGGTFFMKPSQIPRQNWAFPCVWKGCRNKIFTRDWLA